VNVSNPVYLRDALYNLSANNPFNPDYARAMLVGVVSGLMACGFPWIKAMAIASANAPKSVQPGSVPRSWLVAFGLTEETAPVEGVTEWVRTEGIE
jgi:hypothetical protein